MIEHRLKKAIDWIEANLAEDMSSADPAKIACLSEYHFRRLFTALVGISPGLYIRRRRLSRAAEALLASRRPVIDIALDSGFDSPEAFTRAYRKMFGRLPSEHRRHPSDVTALCQPPVDDALFRHLTKGTITMTPRFETLPAFHVTGLGADFTVGQPDAIGQLWDRFIPRKPELGDKTAPAFGICHSPLVDGMPGDDMHYVAGLETAADAPIPLGMERIVLPANTYAVFTHTGDVADLQQTNRYIWKIWLPQSGRELVDAPDFERYDDHNQTIEIWVPVKPV